MPKGSCEFLKTSIQLQIEGQPYAESGFLEPNQPRSKFMSGNALHMVRIPKGMHYMPCWG